MEKKKFTLPKVHPILMGLIVGVIGFCLLITCIVTLSPDDDEQTVKATAPAIAATARPTSTRRPTRTPAPRPPATLRPTATLTGTRTSIATTQPPGCACD